MVKTHEIDLDVNKFTQFVNNNYIILNVSDISINDYILFRQVAGGDKVDTGLYRLVQVKDIVEHEGLKEGYVLLIVNKL